MASYQPLAQADALPSSSSKQGYEAGSPAPAQPREAMRADALSEPYASLARSGNWSSGFLDCCSLPGGTELCCTSFWCPCWQYGLIAEQLPVLSTLSLGLTRDPDGVILGGSKCGACLAFFVLSLGVSATFTGLGMQAAVAFPCHVPLHLQLRTFLRKKYGMQGDSTTNLVEDALVVWCCGPCALCQEAREIMIRSAAERAELVRPTTTAPPQIYAMPPAVQPPAAAYGTPMPMGGPPPVTGFPVVPAPMPGKHD